MKDIDFDELDRAVNSLIGPQQQGAVVQTEPAIVDLTTQAPVNTPLISSDNIPAQNTDTTVAPATPANVTSNNSTVETSNKTAENTKYVPVYYPARSRPLITTPINPPKPMPVNTFESLASKRSAGRFVDVVNPSANVQMSAKVEQVPAPVQTATVLEQPMQINQGAIVNPASNVVQNIADPVASMTPVTPVLPTAPVMPITPIAPVVNQPAVVTPVSTPQQPAVAPALPVDNEDDDIEQISNFINETMSAGAGQKAQESPFLADSKVDKRPLGVSMFAPQPVQISNPVAIQPPVIAPISQIQPANNIAMQAQQMPIAQVAPAANFNTTNSQLPPELQNDLLSIESDTMPDLGSMQTVEMPIATPVVPMQAPQPVPVAAQPVAAGQSISIAPVVAPSQNIALQTTAPQPVMQASIPQQYPERPAVVDHTTTPIYDANAYHKIDAKSSKKSPLMWLFWVLGLIVIGAGVGVIAYFFILPNL